MKMVKAWHSILLLFALQTCMADTYLQFSTLRTPEITPLKLEIADNEFSRQLGLMGRQKMSEDEAMLFVFEEKKPLYQIQSFGLNSTLYMFGQSCLAYLPLNVQGQIGKACGSKNMQSGVKDSQKNRESLKIPSFLVGA